MYAVGVVPVSQITAGSSGLLALPAASQEPQSLCHKSPDPISPSLLKSFFNGACAQLCQLLLPPLLTPRVSPGRGVPCEQQLWLLLPPLIHQSQQPRTGQKKAAAAFLAEPTRPHKPRSTPLPWKNSQTVRGKPQRQRTTEEQARENQCESEAHKGTPSPGAGRLPTKDAASYPLPRTLLLARHSRHADTCSSPLPGWGGGRMGDWRLRFRSGILHTVPIRHHNFCLHSSPRRSGLAAAHLRVVS